MEFDCNSPAQKAFMELVRCGTLGVKPDEGLFGGLSGADWEEIYSLARRQTVCGICYDAYCDLPDSLLPAGSLLPRWVARVNAVETSSRLMSDAVGRLIGSLAELGLHPLVQKGLSVARFYISPELRECGDIDLWLPADEMDRAIAFARTIDSNIQSHPDGSLSFRYSGFVVELHRRLISISSPRARRIIDSMVAAQCTGTTAPDGRIPSPAPLLELLLVSVHIMRHVFGTGIGLRQICDYMRAAYALAGNYDREEFGKLCRDLGISGWTALLNAFLVKYMHADPAVLPPSGRKKGCAVSPDALMKIIMEGGNFGQHHAGAPAAHAGGKIHTASMLMKRSRMSLTIAPAEAFWNFVRLIIGQVH